MTSAEHGPHGAPGHLTLAVAAGLIVGLLAISGIVYSGSGPLTFGSAGALLLEIALAVSVLTMAAGIIIILVRFR